MHEERDTDRDEEDQFNGGDGTRHDAGDKLGYLGANLAWALKRDDLRPGLLALMRRLVDENR